MRNMLIAMAVGAAALGGGASQAQEAAAPGAYLEITLQIDETNRGAAAEVYARYKEPFLGTVDGALTKTLLVRAEDVQVLHGFETVENARAYLDSDLFKSDVVTALSPYLTSDPDIRIYEAR